MAKAGIRGTVRLIGVARRNRSALMVSTALQAVVVMVLAVPAQAQPAPNARPSGGVVVGGAAAIAQSAANTTISQSSQRAAIDWRSFNVGSQQSVTFRQPNASAIALNTVTGPNPSQIAGRIDANGQVVLVNQSGVTFYKGAQVNTAGLMVSASATDPKAFMTGGKVAFNRPGDPNARIINNGNITISGAGLASLVAPSVANAGTINATLGHVVLAGAKTATLDLYGDKLVTVNVTGALTQAPNGDDALVTNTGVIRADGGTVRLTARAVDGVVTNLVSAGGEIRARSTRGHTGDIAIEGVGGSITISGNLDATGRTAGSTGGRIGLLASDAVIVKSGAVVNASGASGGGTIAIGTTLKRAAGGPAVTGARTAKGVLIQPGATVAANATGEGNGGRVTVLSTDVTAMQGTIAAKGGPAGGDGGFVEVSGSGAYSLTGSVDLSAPMGNLGTILLDPTNLTIVAGANGAGDQDAALTVAGTILFNGADTTNNQVSNGALQSLTGNILLQAVNDLTVAAPITLTGAGQSLTMQAGDNLIVQSGAPISTMGNITLSAAEQTITGFTARGELRLNDVVGTSSGTVRLLAGTAGLTINANVAGTTVDLISTGTIAQTAGSISAVTLTGSAMSSASLNQPTNLIGTLGAFSTGQGFALTDNQALLVNGVVSDAGGATMLALTTKTGDLTLAGTISAANTLSLISAGSINQSAGIISAIMLTGSSAASTTLTGAAAAQDQIANLGAFTATTGTFSLTSGESFNVTGAVSAPAGDIVLHSAGGGHSIAVAGSLAAASTGTVSVQADAISVTGTVTGAVFEYAQDTAGVLNVGVGGAIVDLTGIGTGLVRLGSVRSAATPIATAITLTSSLDLGTGNGGTARALDLQSNGDIADGGNALLNVTTLTGVANNGSVSLGNSLNTVATLGRFTAGAGFALVDSADLTVAGILSAAPVSLTAPNISLSGAIATGGSAASLVNLVANAGTIGGTGSIATGTLTGSAILGVNLSGGNQIDVLGSFIANGLTLNSVNALDVTGVVNGRNNGLAITSSGALTIDGTATAQSISLNGQGIAINGLVADGPAVLGGAAVGGRSAAMVAASVTLNANSGSIVEPGTLIAVTLIGTAAAISLLGTAATTNQVGSIGSLVSPGGIALNDGVALTVNGVLSGGAGVTVVSTGLLTNNGTISGPMIGLTADTLALGGVVSAGSLGTIVLTANIGGIDQTGTLIAGMLSGSAPSPISLAGASATANQIGTIGPLAAPGILLNDGTALAVVNTVNGGAGAVTLNSTGLLSVVGTVSAAAVALTGTAVSVGGVVTDGGTGIVNLVATGGGITGAGTIIAGTLTGASADSVSLTGANTIGALGSFSLTAGSLALNDGSPLTVSGTVSGPGGVTIADAGSLTITGTIVSSAGNVVLAAGGAGGVLINAGSVIASGDTVSVAAQTLGFLGATGTIIADTFEFGPESAGGTVTLGSAFPIGLIGAANIRAGKVNGGDIAGAIVIAGYDNGGKTLELDTTGTVSQTAALTGVSNLTGTAAGFELATFGNAIGTLGGAIPIATGAAGTLAVWNDQPLTLSGLVSAGTVDLSTSNRANITQAAGATLIAGVLTSTNGIDGRAIMRGTANRIGAISGLTATGITVVDSSALTLAGRVSAGVSGTIDVSTSAGANLVQSAGGILVAGVLTSASGIGGTAILGSSANAIGTIRDFSATALLEVVDGTGMTVAGAVGSSTGNVFLTTGTNTLSFAAGGSVASVAGGRVGIQADGLANLGFAGATGSVNTGAAGVFELAPSSQTIVTLGSAAGLSLTDLTGIAAGTLRIGAVTLPGSASPTVTAGSISVTGPFEATAIVTLDLEAKGTISQSPNATITNLATLLAGTNGVAGDIDLGDTLNSIATIGDIAVTAGNFSFGDTPLSGSFQVAPGQTVVANNVSINVVGTLLVNGVVTASGSPGNVALSAHGPTADLIVETGAITATNTASLTADRAITQSGGFIDVNGGSVTETAGSLLSVGGTVSAAAVSLAGSGIAIPGEVTDGGFGSVTLIATSGTINETGTLVAGTLSGGSALGATTLTGTNQVAALGSFAALSFILNDGASLAVNGVLSGGSAVTISDAAPLTVAGNISAGAISLSAASISIPGTVTDGGAGTVSLIATGGTINETGTLIADTLSGRAVGAVTITGASPVTNKVTTLGAFDASGFALTDGIPLSVNGVVSGGSAASITDIAALTIAGTVNALTINLTAAFVAIPGEVTDGGAGTVSLVATAGTINESGTLIAGTLSGGSTLASTTLTGSNQVAAIGSFTAGGFTLNDGASLSVNGVLSGGTAVTIADTASLNVAGDINAGSISLTASSISIPGTVTNGGSGTVNLIATGGTIDETGTLIAGTLSGNATGSATLTGASPATNQVTTLGSFTASGFTLNDGTSLIVGVVSGGTNATITDNGSLTIGGTANAASISLTAASIAIPGEVTDGGAGAVSLTATTGTINEVGTLIAGTLSGGATLAATTLTGSNQIAVLGSFTASGFTLNDGVSLSVNGNLNGGPGVTIADLASLTIPGTISATAISLASASIAIPGVVTAGGAGTVSLIATTGTIGETGTLIAGTLSGSSTLAATTLTGANQVAVLGLFTAVGFSLNDAANLVVSGVLSGGPGASIADLAALSIGGRIDATAISLTGARIAIPGIVTNGGAGTVNLIATGGTIDETGTLTAGTLSGRATGTATLTGATPATNQVTTLGSFIASGFTLNDGLPLSVNGVLSGGSAASIADTAALTISGTVNALAIGLTAASISIPGEVSDGGGGTVSLIATAGTINESGTLVTGTLSGGSTLAATMLTGSNQVAALGSFTAAGFTLNDGVDLAVNGPLAGGPAATITDAALLNIAGRINADAINLAAANIAIPGTVTDGGTGMVTLIATGGTIDETGTLIAGTLSGHSSGAAALTGATPATNQVTTLGSFAAQGFRLNDGVALSVNGMLTGGPNATITDAGSLTIGGAITAAAISLTAASIAIPGTVTDSGTGTVSLVAIGGTINETGTLIAGTLSGRATGATTLTGSTPATNQVTTLGSFTATGFTLDDGVSLSVSSSLNGGPGVTIADSASLNIPGGISATAINLTAASIAIPGFVTDGGTGTVGLIATAGTIGETGTLIAGTLSGHSTGATMLAGATPTANQVAALGSFTALGFTLNDSAALSVNGALSGGPAVTISDSASLKVAGDINATSVNLTAASIAIPGTVTDGGTGMVNLIATAGTIDETGTLIAGTLSGSATGAATLTAATPATNQVATLASFTASGFTLNDGASLSVNGAVTGGLAMTISDLGALNIGGSVNALAINLTGASVSIPGEISDGGTGTVGLIATTGTIGETGTLIAGTLSGSSVLGATTLTGTNQVAAIGSFTAVGFTLNDSASLAVNGAVSGGPNATIVDTAALTIGGTLNALAINLTAVSIAIPGEVTDGGFGTVNLTATGGTISETGILIAGTLSGRSTDGVTLNGATPATNQVATLGSFTATGFTLNDGASLSVNGVLSGGPAVTVTDAASLNVAGNINAGAISLTAASISIPGTVTDGGSGIVNLIATGGTINETGTLIAGTLSGSSTGATTLTGASAKANQIELVSTFVNGFTAAGFTLNDGRSLDVGGLLNGGTAVTINVAAGLAIDSTGTVSASAVSLMATNIIIDGNGYNAGAVTDGGAGTVSLIATAGSIYSIAGVVIAGTLSGGSTGSTLLQGGLQIKNQIATLGDFTAAGFTLDDSKNLTVSGTVNGGTAAAISDSGVVSIGGALSASAISIFAANIAIPGFVTDGGAGTVSLNAAGTINETGTLVAGTLSGSSGGATTLTGATPTTNQVANIGAFTAAGFLLNDGVTLIVNGTLSGGASATIATSGPLTITGTLNAASISLIASEIAIPGVVTDGGSGTVSLVATSGTIDETGTLIAGTLSGGSSGTTNLSGAANQVAVIGDFSAAGFSLTDSGDLTVAGTLNGGPGIFIAEFGIGSGQVSVAGTVAASAVTLLSDLGIAIPGEITDGGFGTVTLSAPHITESGVLIAGTLIGPSSPAETSLTGANQVASLGSFLAVDFTLNDNMSLQVNGPLTSRSLVNGARPAQLTINDAGNLSILGLITGPSIALTAVNITIANTGVLSDGGAGTTILHATGDAIDDLGFLIAGTLSGGSAGPTTLNGNAGTANQVSVLGSFSASGFTLNDGASLTIAGSLNGGSVVALTDSGSISAAGTVSATLVGLTGSAISIGGVVTGGGSGTVNLVATAGTINETGMLVAGTLAGSASGAATLTGSTPTTNQVATVTNFSAASFVLNDGESLSVSGQMQAPGVFALIDTGNLTIGSNASINAGTLSIADSGDMTVNGAIASAGSAGINASGTLSIPGTVSAVAGVTIASTGDMSVAGEIASSTGTVGIAAQGALLATGLISGQTGLTVAAAGPTTVSGSLVSAAGAIGITDNGGLTVSGIITGRTGVTIADVGPMSVGGTITSPGGAVGITANGGLTVAGLITGQSGVTIAETGPMSVIGDIVSAAGISGITVNGALTVPGVITGQTGVTITDTGAMTVAGAISSAGGVVAITDNGTLTVSGTIRGQNGVTQAATGDMDLSGLFASPTGFVAMTDAGILTLANTTSIAASSSIAITDFNTMNLAGVLNAPRIVVDNGSGTATVLNGTLIETGGQSRPPGPLPMSRLPSSTSGSSGFFITTGQLTQDGVLTVTAQPNSIQASTVRIDASTGVTLAASPNGLVAPNSWFVLGLSNGAKAVGGIDVLYLDTVFTGVNSSATLSGTVGGLTGNEAAGAAYIAPNTNATFKVNGCPIASINCVLLTTQNIPAASPLNNFFFGSIFDQTDQDDLLLPLVSDEVY